MSSQKVEIEVIGNIKQILASLSDLNKRFDRFATATEASIKNASDKLNGFQGSIVKLGLAIQSVVYMFRSGSNFLKGFIVESNSAEQAEAALTQALINTGRYTKEAMVSIKEYAAERQKATIYDDDATLQAAAMLEAMTGLDEKGLRPLIKATQDFASAQRMDLVSAAELMAKTIGSDVNALGRYGIEVEGAAGSQERLQKLLAGVNARFRDQAEALARTDAGKLIQFNNAIGYMREEVGTGIKRALIPLVEVMIKITGGVNQAGEAIQGLVSHVAVLAAGVVALVVKIKYGGQILEAFSLKTAGVSLSIRGLGVALKSLYASLGPVGWAIIALTAAYEVMLAIKNRHIQKTQAEIEKQRELQTELNRIANSYDIEGLQAEIDARQINNQLIDAEIKKLSQTGPRMIIERRTRIIQDEEKVMADIRKKRIAELEAQKAENDRIIYVLKQQVELIKSAGILTKDEIELRKTLADLEAKNSGKERERLEARLKELGAYNKLTTAQKIEYQQIRGRINEIDAADAARLRALEDIKNSMEYLTAVEGKSREEARKSALEYLQTRIEAARKADDAEALFKYSQLKQQIEIDEARAISAKKDVETQKTILEEKLAAIKGAGELEIIERKRIQLELMRLNEKINEHDYAIQKNRLEIERDAAQERLNIYKKTNEDIAAIITGGGFGAAYETVLSRIRQKLVAAAIEETKLALWVEKVKYAIKEAWAGKTLAMEQLFSGKEILLNMKTALSNFIAGMANLFKSVMKIPFPGNVLAFATGGATVIGLLNSFKTKGQAVIRAAEGALINKPTLALVGEAVARSGPEIIMPEKSFKRYMEQDVMPEFRAKLDTAVRANVSINTSGIEERLERVERAIKASAYEMGKMAARYRRGQVF